MQIANKIVNYVQSIGLYFSASLIPMLLNLAINPLIAINMSPQDYAITGYYTSFSTLLSPLIAFYMLHYYTKRYFEVTEEQRIELRAILFKALIYFSGFIAILCLLGLIIYIKIFNKDSTLPLMPYAAFAVLALPLTGVYSLLLVDLRMSRNSKSFFKISVANGLLLVCLNLFFVVIVKWGALGKLLAPLITNCLFFIWVCYKYRELFHFPFDKKQFSVIIKFCTPLTIAAMLVFFSNGYDRVFLERLGNIQELGYYIVGVQIAGYITIFQTALGATFQPDIFQSIANRDYKKLAKISSLLIGGVSIIVIFFIVAAPLIIQILTAGRYMQSVKYTQIVAFSTITSAIYYTISQVTIAFGKSYITLFNKIITSVFSIALFSMLINKYQFQGAAWGLVLSFLISAIGNIILLAIFKLKSEVKKHETENS